MSSLTTRSIVLAFARISNYAIQFLSPIFLVRLLDVEAFGQYREFLLYAVIIGNPMHFAIDRSLPYFLPKFPSDERVYVTQAALYQLVFFFIGLVFILLLEPLILSATSFDFILPLALYLFFSVNLDFLEFYWLAKRRSDYVFYYSSARLIIRMTTVVVAAYYTRDVLTIIYALIAVEALRFFLALLYLLWQRLIVSVVHWHTLKQQLVFFMPLGLGSVLVAINLDVGKLIISANLGVAALAFYVVGTYTAPIIDSFRTSVADVIFPEIVSIDTDDPRVALRLWRRATVLYCLILFPMAFGLFYYADVFIITIFTDEYVEAIPIFMIYLFLLMRECFDFNLVIRTLNRNVFTLIGDVIALVLNLGLILLLLDWLGLIGPAVAFIVADLVMAIYLGWQVMRLTRLSLAELLPWGQIAIVLMACILSLPILLIGEYLPVHDLVRAVLFSIMFGVAYLAIVRYARIEEALLLEEKLVTQLAKVRLRIARRGKA